MIGATLFSGIGAPECAMPDWDWRWCAEIEKFPSAVLKARHPKSINLGDVNAEDFVARAESAGRPDVIIFGSPCQDFSVAGRRVGMDGNRGNLALVALGIVNRIRPRWVVFENVPGLLSSRSGSAEAERSVREGPVGTRSDSDEDSDFAAFLTLVQQCGYFGCYRITDAQYAGVPQRRRRIFAVFHLGDWRPAAAVLFEPEGLRGDYPPSRETGEGVAPTISARPTGGGGLGTDFDDCDGGLIANTLSAARGRAAANAADLETYIAMTAPVGSVSSKWAKGTGGPSGDECYNLVAATLEAASGRSRGAGTPIGLIAFNGRQDPDVYGDRTGPLDTDPGTQVLAFTSKDYGADAGATSPTLRAMGFDGSHANGGGQVAVAFQTRVARNGRGDASDVVPALNGADAGATSDMRPCVAVFKPSHFTRGKDGAPSGLAPPLGAESDKGEQDPILMAGTAVRRLTPVECERLQAFPDFYTDITFRGKPAADGPRYKALGNAMNVNEIRWVLTRIETFDNNPAICKNNR